MDSKHAPLHAVLALLSIALFAFTLGRMSVNALLFFSIVALAGLMTLGIFVSWHPDRQWVKQRRSGLGIIFATLGIAGALVAAIQGLRSNNETFGVKDQLTAAQQRLEKQENELTAARGELARLREEANRVQALNRDLQQKLLEQSTQLKDLALQKVAEATGGDGFAYLDLAAPVGDSGVALQARVNGSYDLRQVKYRIGGGALIELGDLKPSAPRTLETVLHPPRESGARYEITILAANGPVREDLELRFNPTGQRWERRVRVLRGNALVLERGWGR